jgi:DNA-binding response OmpR family regulator
MTQLSKILLVNDDLRVALSEQLMMTEDFDVFEAGNLNDTLVRTNAWHFDLLILYVGLPDIDGQ